MASAITTETTTRSWSDRLRILLDNIEPLGSFVHYQKLLDLPCMQLNVTVEGFGRVGFPMSGILVDALIALSDKAPFGQRDKTLTDDKIRNAWQIDASKVTIADGELWSTYFNSTLRQVCYNLGISNERFESTKVKANLYKMLIYEEGGHFVPHRDTEKEVGMFGTLIVQLPTGNGFSGGTTTVTHKGVTKTIDSSTGSDNDFQVVAFYADCEHQLHPVTKGKRVCLVFNLVASADADTPLDHLVNIDAEANLQSIAEDWKAENKCVQKLGYQLNHEYTHQTFGFTSLKGRDHIVFTTLRNARTPYGERLFRIWLLLQEWCVWEDRVIDDKSDEFSPFLVIEENVEGSFVTKRDVKKDWLMFSKTKNGWWKCKDELENNDDNTDANTDESTIETYEGHEIPHDMRMFEKCIDKKTVEHMYYGNDGGHSETFYYAAAIVFSPQSGTSKCDVFRFLLNSAT